MDKKYLFIGLGGLIVAGFLAWLFIESSRPLPGKQFAYDCSSDMDFSQIGDLNGVDKCRVHIPLGAQVTYGSNPPVFGPHYPEWTKAGVYSTVNDDRNLVHSLEHGYV